MAPSALAKRVEVLELKVETLSLLPERVGALEVQIVQFRAEVRDEFSAVRAGMREGFTALRAEVVALNQDTQRQMRVLHEEVLSRIALLHESRNGRARPCSRAVPQARRHRSKKR